MPPSQLPPKPRSESIRPEIVRLPPLSRRRIIFRRFISWLARLAVWLCTRAKAYGLENIPRQGAVLAVSNHLGDADLIVGMAFSIRLLDSMAKAELYDYPVLGKTLDAYGIIWVHRGQPDRRALRAVIDGLKEGRIIVIAPEGRESLSGALEEGTNGAAYLALKAGVPVLPVTLTGTENTRIFGNLKRLRRTPVTMTVGRPFYLEAEGDRQIAIERGTEKIMRALAGQLPPEYRGVYQK